MKFTLFIVFIISASANVTSAQDRDRPSPAPGLGPAGGPPGIGGGRFPVPGAGGGGGPAGGGGVPGASGGFGGVPPMGVGGMPSGGMMGGGMGVPGLGFSDIPNRFQLFTGEVVPEGKDKPLPMILKIDTQTGQVWQLQAGAQNKVRFVVIAGQPGHINGPQLGFGAGGPVDPTTGLPLLPRPQDPQAFPNRPLQPSPRPEPR